MLFGSGLNQVKFSIPDQLKERYPFNIAFISELADLKIDNQVTFFLGENGCGKSTLLEAIALAHGLNAEGGSQNVTFKTRDSHSKLANYISLVYGIRRPKDSFFLRSESFFNLATQLEDIAFNETNREFAIGDLDDNSRSNIYNTSATFQAYGGKSLHEQSHGESFWSVINKRMGKRGLYLLDEPEAAMSPTTQMAMLCKMKELCESGTQFIIATHSPILIAYPNALIYEIGQGKISRKTYKETALYQCYSHFLNDTEAQLKVLLADE